MHKKLSKTPPQPLRPEKISAIMFFNIPLH